MKRIITTTMLCLAVLLNVAAASQPTMTIRGKVYDKNSGAPLQYASAVLMAADSTVVAGATTDEEGAFSLSAKGGEYTLTISFISYKEYSAKVDSGKDPGIIYLEPDAEALASAVVQARKPVLEQKLDKLVMNVAEAASTQGSNARDVLRRAPGVAIDKDGNVTLNGQPVAVWIDGRPSNLSGKNLESYLSGMDGSTLDKIEIMAHPSAKYDAAGSGGLINIRLKKNHLQGFNGSVNLSGGGMLYDDWDYRQRSSLNLGYRSDKSNTTLRLGQNLSRSGLMIGTSTSMDEGAWKQESMSEFSGPGKGSSIRFTHDWFINASNTLGAIITYNRSSDGINAVNGKSYTNIFMNGELISRQISEIENTDTDANTGINLNYTHIFDAQKAREITFNADYAVYNITGTNSQFNPYVDESGAALAIPEPVKFTSDAAQKIKISSLKADYQSMVWGKMMMEAGVKAATTSTFNDNVRQDFTAGNWIKNEGYSSLFDYRETIGAAYADLAGQLGKFTVKAGLRAEGTWSSGDWKSIGAKSDTSYINIFPTIYAGYNPSMDHRLALSYTRRIGRPTYSQLNPQIMYFDATSSLKGNPYLTPAFTHMGTFTYGYKSWLNITLLYQDIRDMIMQQLDKEGGNGAIIKWDNFGRQTMYGGTLAITELELTKWMILNANILGVRTISNAGDSQYNVKDWMGNGDGAFTFLLPKDWKIEIGADWQSNLTMGYINAMSTAWAYGAIKKDIFDKKGTISFTLDDIFRSSRSDVAFNSNGFRSYIREDMHMQSAIISFSYRFGKTKAVKSRKVGNLEESSRVGGSSLGK